jgi:hypothetical protein
MATNTYVALSKQTVSVAASNITFSAIPATYTDLVLVLQGAMAANARVDIYVGNGTVDNNANYSNTSLFANGVATTTTSLRNATTSSMQGMFDSMGTGTNQVNSITHFQNYANTSVRKTVMGRFNSNSNGAGMFSGLWRSTSAIDIITLTGTSNFAVGTTASLYGIRAEGISPAPKATGGAIYSDDTYYYHAFGATGTFTPLQSLTADILVVAGGGGGGSFTGGNGNGGGGAGGLLSYSSQSLTATGYTCTVGGGGAGGLTAASSASGGNSQFGALTASVGGGRGANGGSASNASAVGGSGGGGQGTNDIGFQTGSAGTSGQGFAGGNGTGGATAGGGGGGGAGAVGAAGGAAIGGVGGIGATSAFINSIGAATGTGQLVSGAYYFAGGGGGSTSNTGSGLAVGGSGGGGTGGYEAVAGTAGLPSSGGGGGAGRSANGGNGGSGVVIVRYAKA